MLFAIRNCDIPRIKNIDKNGILKLEAAIKRLINENKENKIALYYLS